jgi:two-component system, NtrC family, sensor histidine kinase KinB
MFTLKSKLIAGFASLLAVAIIVSVVGLTVINSYSEALQRVLRENYNSMVYCEGMQSVLGQMNAAFQEALWNPDSDSPNAMETAIADFERLLASEKDNITLPGEADSVRATTSTWQRLLAEYPLLFLKTLPDSNRRELYRDQIQPLVVRTHGLTQHISDMNLSNMVAVDGQAQLQAAEAKRITYALVAAGMLLALVLIYITGRSVLQPLNVLTRSIREVQQGNLNLVLNPRHRDEVGQLMEAFNDMAAQLRVLKQGEQAKLARSQQSAQLVLDALPDAVVVMAPDATVELVNDAARKILGVHPGSSIYETSAVWVNSIALDGPKEHGASGDSGPKIRQAFVDGKEHFFLPRVVPIPGEGGLPVGLILMFVDVTRLRRVSEMENNLVSTVSHEIKTPLTSVRMALHMLLDERVGGLNPRQSELVSTARDDAERLFAIVNDLLEVARYESGEGGLELKPVPAQRLLDAAVEHARPGYQQAGVALRVALPPELPVVLANEPRVAHVFSNLLANALRFSAAGGDVELSVTADEETVAFSVHDQGAGIPKEDLPRVFDRFYRGKDTVGTEGAGLGLAIAREVVEAHGGQIRVESRVGQGTTFTFTLRRSESGELAHG